MVTESWGWNCVWCIAEGHGFVDEAFALRAEIAHYEGDCTDPEASAKAEAGRERLAVLSGEDSP